MDKRQAVRELDYRIGKIVLATMLAKGVITADEYETARLYLVDKLFLLRCSSVLNARPSSTPAYTLSQTNSSAACAKGNTGASYQEHIKSLSQGGGDTTFGIATRNIPFHMKEKYRRFLMTLQCTYLAGQCYKCGQSVRRFKRC
jgi:hypothetical protein